ncbi:MAG TPA: hypothetical protein VLG76_05375 [Rhabdochlamydiaceae bacterium]|nr:hypothetical protein [Rhabdochlamydiaceae bacterium]
MRINHKILSIPPYISTSWKNVLSLHIEHKEEAIYLVINMVNGSFIEIPNLEPKLIEAIFAAHEKAMEQETNQKKPLSFFGPKLPPIPGEPSPTIISFPFRIGADGNPENMSTLLQHNPDAAAGPDLPKDVLEKIASLSKMIGLDNTETFSKAEPHCNCTYCQIMRAVHPDGELIEESEEEIITEDDLKFRDWEIKQTADKLYIVTNPLDKEEHYNVFVGSPVGCTCGAKNCEHLRAVLNS